MSCELINTISKVKFNNSGLYHQQRGLVPFLARFPNLTAFSLDCSRTRAIGDQLINELCTLDVSLTLLNLRKCYPPRPSLVQLFAHFGANLQEPQSNGANALHAR